MYITHHLQNFEHFRKNFKRWVRIFIRTHLFFRGYCPKFNKIHGSHKIKSPKKRHRS